MPLIAWSWSRLDCFEKCPKQFYEKNISKSVKFEQTPQMERGSRIHDSLEAALKGTQLPPELNHVTPIIAAIKAVSWDTTDVEVELAYRQDMSRTRWFAKDVWLRVKHDFVGVVGDRAVVYDWKTGKNYGYTDQLKLYAGEVFHRYPNVTEVNTAYVYVDAKDKCAQKWTRDQYNEIWDDFGERAELIQIANQNGDWPPKPSKFNCKWCPVNDCQARQK